ncbi:MAG: tRNA pseudouridine synthase B [Candidatus Moanabacter tarae]|uniref:tRNA pseudouridine synthase B n=1 Tax=Candidatus Moanibacter tarae TaxID=2200854 RepID=A0A2Z4AG25_9BACT|nr:MAG: tRNA pseudouridine synthase B [Candidatus Moanabacter tarae]|tara:strand:+ start:3694 stop:4419 length:726 start_codon:yes stop_codon:yes gene_type:complete
MVTPWHNFEGVLLVDKPAGLTSHDVVDRVRAKVRMKRVGHAGTLDPNASGLLIILVGKATKISRYLMSLDKSYEGSLVLGKSTDSHDVEGVVIEEHKVPELTKFEMEQKLSEFQGDQYQIPPMFSAKKVKGVALYKLARKGKEIEREPRFIRVTSIEMLDFESPKVQFRIECSKGTYVRTIVHDLGQKIGCGAYLATLRRTAIERFLIEDAISLKELESTEFGELQRILIPVYQAVPSNVL